MEGIKPNQARPGTEPDQSEGSAGQLGAVARTEGALGHEHGVRAQAGSCAQGEEKGWGTKQTTEEIPVTYMRQTPELYLSNNTRRAT